MNCNEAVAALIASLENGTPMTAEQREHIRICGRCRELLDSAKQFQTLLAGNGIQPPPVDATLAATAEEVRRRRMWRALKIMAVCVAVFVLGMASLFAAIGEMLPQALIFISAGIAAASMIALTIAVLLLLVRGGTRRIYKRLGPGRVLSGVCLGIAEATRVDVRLIRLGFFALLFADGIGLALYILLDLAMPVHPDDRQYLLRFRLRRWWARTFAKA